MAKARPPIRMATTTWVSFGLRNASSTEDPPADRCGVGEDADAEHHDDAGRQLRTHAQLVAEVDHERGDHDVRDERHDEDPVVETPFAQRTERTDDRVEGR